MLLYIAGKSPVYDSVPEGEEWGHQFISLDYDKKKSDKGNGRIGALGCGTVLVSGDKIRDACREISHGTVLSRAMELCREETGKCDWYNIPEIYWEEAVQELLGC